MVILNSPTLKVDLVKRLWNNAELRFCADGGANRLHDSLPEDERSAMLPHSIIGDLDSIRPAVADYYRSRGVCVRCIEDQNENDLDKTVSGILEVVQEREQAAREWTVVVLGPFGGRMDQELAAIHSSFKWMDTFQRLVLLSDETVAHALSSGTSSLLLRRGVEGPHCGIYALVEPAVVSSKGLVWNMQDTSLAMGVTCSSSNQIDYTCRDDETIDSPRSRNSVHTVTISTDRPIFWTCSLFGE